MKSASQSSRLFIWVAHPRLESLSKALADAYQSGAIESGSEVRRLDLASMEFDNNFTGYGGGGSPLSPDLQRWQENVSWSSHLLFVYPYWWGGMPAMAKAVLDQALLPKFAFKYHRRGLKWDKLLAGKTGDAIITSDTIPWMDTLFYRKPGRRVIKNQVFDFCGIKPNEIVQFGSVKRSSSELILKWLDTAHRMGRRLPNAL